MSDKKIHIEGISQEVTLRRNTRIKRLSVKLNTHSGVVLCVPYGISEQKAMLFFEQHKEWVQKHLQNKKYKLQKIPEEVQLATALVVFEKTEHNIPKIQQENNKIVITIPDLLNFTEKEELKRKQLTKVLRKEAKVFLTERVAQLASIHGFRYGKLSFRNQKTRWGSCSFHNAISLNIQLMRLPLHLIDYVIIHELCHTVHKNHSAKFWQLVYKKIGANLYSCEKDLHEQRIEL